MKKTDIGVVAFMYAVCGYFYSQTLQLKADSQTYPKFTIILLFGLTTLYLVEMIIAAKRHGVESGVDEVFKDFVPAQFFVCLCAAILYLVCIHFLGFYIATVLFMAAVLLYLRVPPLAALKTPLRDGDLERPEDPAYAGCWFLNANSTIPVGIVDAACSPILDRGEFYSGCYGRASISFFAFNSNGNRGIACGLNNLQKLRDGEPLGGRVSAEADFAGLDDDDDEELLS